MQDGGRSGCVLHPGDQPTAQTRDQMIDMLRAGGFAAAAVALVAATTFADPSQASKIDMAPAVNALTEHAAATIDAGSTTTTATPTPASTAAWTSWNVS